MWPYSPRYGRASWVPVYVALPSPSRRGRFDPPPLHRTHSSPIPVLPCAPAPFFPRRREPIPLRHLSLVPARGDMSLPHKQTTGILAISGRGGSRTALPLFDPHSSPTPVIPTHPPTVIPAKSLSPVKTGTGIQCAAPQPPVRACLVGACLRCAPIPPLVGAGLPPPFIGRTPRPSPSRKPTLPRFQPLLPVHVIASQTNHRHISHSLVGAVREPPFPSHVVSLHSPPSRRGWFQTSPLSDAPLRPPSVIPANSLPP